MFVREHALYYGIWTKSSYALYTRTEGVQSLQPTILKDKDFTIHLLSSLIVFLFNSATYSGTKNVIDACKICKVKRLIHTSSSAVVFDGIHGLFNVNESLPYPDKVVWQNLLKNFIYTYYNIRHGHIQALNVSFYYLNCIYLLQAMNHKMTRKWKLTCRGFLACWPILFFFEYFLLHKYLKIVYSGYVVYLSLI